MVTAVLPLDVIYLICDELAARNDFDTLYNCVISGRYIASTGAVAALYRISHECFTSAVRSRDIPEEAALAGEILQKTTILWRSIILSALGKACYPYCQYLRVLDLRDLGGLLDDGRFTATKMASYFFEGPLAQFSISHGTGRTTRARALNVPEILLRISNVVLQKATLIESLSDPSNATVFAQILPTHTARLTHLRQLDFASGDVLSDASVRADLRKHCPNLQAVRIFSYANDEADANLADFLNGIGKLVHFEIFSLCGVKDETCIALSRHGSTLRHLKMMLDEDGFKSLPKLAGCRALETLALHGTTLPPSLKAVLGDEFPPMVAWLSGCENLYEVLLKNIPFAPELATPVLEARDNLRSLEIEADERSLFMVDSNMDLFTALATQRKLEVLTLEGNAENATLQQLSALLYSVGNIRSLRHLQLRRLGDSMADEGISNALPSLFQQLPALESLYYNGVILGDASIDGIIIKGSVLKSISLAGYSNLSFGAYSKLVDSLGAGNHGFVLSIEFADPDNSMSTDEQMTIRSRLVTEHGGAFTYILIRDEADDYSESDFSD